MRTPSSRNWSRPCEDASSTRCVTSSPASSSSVRCSATGIGRGQRAVDFPPRRNKPDGADTRGDLPGRLPDLARERGDRSLAAGAGDRGDGVGLVLEQARRRDRQRSARIADAHEGDAVGQRHRRHLLRHDGDRTGIDGALHEAQAVVLGAGHRHEQALGLDLAAVGRDGAHVEIGEPRVAEGIDGEEPGELHRSARSSGTVIPGGRTDLRNDAASHATLPKESSHVIDWRARSPESGDPPAADRSAG